MDPNTTLAEIRKELANINACHATGETEAAAESGERIVELFDALDGWLRKGGFLPADWDRPLPSQQVLVTLPDGQQVGFMHGSIHHRHSVGSTWSTPLPETPPGTNPHQPNTYHIGEW